MPRISVPSTIFLPNRFKALRVLGEDRNNTLHYSIHKPGTTLRSGVIELQWDKLNKLYRPLDAPGVNLYPEAQRQGLYPAFLRELSKFVDVGSASTTTKGTTENAKKVWQKLGALIEDVSGDPNNPQAFVLRRNRRGS